MYEHISKTCNFPIVKNIGDTFFNSIDSKWQLYILINYLKFLINKYI